MLEELGESKQTVLRVWLHAQHDSTESFQSGLAVRWLQEVKGHVLFPRQSHRILLYAA